MPSVELVNESAFKIHFDTEKISESASTINELVRQLRSFFSEDIKDIIPAYSTVVVITDFPNTRPQELIAKITSLLSHTTAAETETNAHTHILPCYYGSEFAWDIQHIADLHNITPVDVIERHTSMTYRVYALGFSPGFPYLGFVDPLISASRRATPRAQVPQGAVGIAENQTGIYPQASPGGWNIIGNCPTSLFDTERADADMSTLSVGDYVQFKAVSHDEFLDLGGTL